MKNISYELNQQRIISLARALVNTQDEFLMRRKPLPFSLNYVCPLDVLKDLYNKKTEMAMIKLQEKTGWSNAQAREYCNNIVKNYFAERN